MRKWIVAGLVALLVVGGAIVYFASSGGGSDSKPLVITATAQARDLRDEVTVQGTVGRSELRTVNSAGEMSSVSRVYLDDGADLSPGQAILALDGRDSVTTEGAYPFFRRLDVGAEGADVAQLNTTLSAAGYPAGSGQRYTQQTQFALAQWQAAHGYPGAAPSTSQAVQVALQQGSGYKLGDQTTAGLTIGPPPLLKATASTTKANAVLTAFRKSGDVTIAAPVLTIASTAGVVDKGAPATFVVNSDTAGPFDFDIELDGTAVGGTDYVVPSLTQSMPSGVKSMSFQILTRANGLVEPDKTLTVRLVDGGDSASVTIVSHDVPQLSLSGTTTVQQGATATLTVTADQAPVTNTQVALQVGGSATPGTDYVSFPPTVTLPAGQKTAKFTITTKTSSTVKPARLIVVSLAPSAAYKVGPVNSATVTIAGTSGNAAIPVVTIRAGALRNPAGQPAVFTIGIDRALSDELQVNVSYSGNAVRGIDYNPAGGLIVIPPGQTSVPVQVPTLDSGIVQNDPALFVTVEPGSGYAVGDPATAGVVIVSETLPKLSIIGGPAAVGQGGGAVFTVVADQAPVKDISVQYTVTGTAKQGQDLEPVTGTVILPVGETTVTIPILTLNTNVFFLPTDMIASTYPTRLGEVLVKEGELAPAGTPLFTLTETTVEVTLSASAADRTKLKVGQVVTVQVQGADASAPGVITELDDTPTTDKETKQQTYKGKVQVRGDLGAADGTPVTIKVVVQERLGALTVPIAAVKQNGSGEDVVRVIDLDNGGKVHEVKVTTGLSEGSYIEIKSGLDAKQVVVVEVDDSGNG